MATVTLNGLRINNADSATGYANLIGGGPSPAAEPQLRYQGAGAVNRKVTTTNSRTGVQYTNGTGRDMTGAVYPLWLAKIKVADAGDLNQSWGVELRIGSSANNQYQYNISGTSANNNQYTSGYSSQGGLAEGYLITALNPNIAQWREGTGGAPVLSSTLYYGIAAQFIVGGAKSENVALDAIDIGVGLNYTGSTFTFQDGISTDQNIIANRWGFACANGSDFSFRGVHTVGAGGVATTGTDTSSVRFPDGYHGTGNAGIATDLSNAATSLAYEGSYVGLGALYTSDDTRPDFVVTGTAGALVFAGELINHNLVSLTSGTSVSNASLGFKSLVDNGATITSTTLSVDSASGVAGAVAPSLSNFSDISWVQKGAGHAIEITATGTYTLDATSFVGFGANATSSAAVHNNSGGLVTLNIVNGGGTPTILNGAGASTTLNNAVPIVLSGLIAGSRVYIANVTDSLVLFNTTEGTTSFSTSVNFAEEKSLLIRVRNSSGSPIYKTYEATGTLTSNGFTLNVNQELDQ